MSKNNNDTKISLIFAAAFILIGLIVGVFITLITTATDKNTAQNQMLAVSQYVKQQCIRYEELADEEVTNSLYDVSDRAFAIRSAIDYASEEIDAEMASEAQSNRLNGIIVTELDVDSSTGKIFSYYIDGNEEIGMWDEIFGSFASVAGNYIKNYSGRLTVGEYYYDYSLVSRGDGNGVVLCYKRRLIDEVENDQFSVMTLLKGFVFSTDGVITVTDGTTVLASNIEGIVGQQAEETKVIRNFDVDVSNELVRITDDGNFYGISTKCKDLYIYTYMPNSNVFTSRPVVLFASFTIYLLAAVVIVTVRQVTLNKKRAEQAAIEERYRAEKENLAQQAILANDAKTDFMRRMSHDLRTPINVIRGMVKIGDYYYDDIKKQSDCRTKIWNASDYLLELVNNVLYMNKLSTDEPDWREEKFCLTNLLSELDESMGEQARESGVTLVTELGNIEHDYLFGSKLQLNRVFTNLIGNSIKYNKQNGSICFSARETGYDKGVASFEFKIIDTGIGMDKEFIKKMYEPFERENRDSGKMLEGVGLGLSIVKQIVSKAGWDLSVESKKGEGSVFTLNLSMKTIENGVNDAPTTEVIDVENCLHGYKVLVAEDNELNYEIVEFVIKLVGADVIHANDGKEATDIFAESKEGDIDIILMDVMMPNVDGLTATRQIRAMNRQDAKTVPIVAMTASAFSDDVKKTEEAGMNAHITKPINNNELIKCMLKLLNKKSDGGGVSIMSLKSFYDAIGGDYADVVNRFITEENVNRFVLRFLTDDSFSKLETAINAKDAESAFLAVHTLKGISQNLGFTNLGKSSAALTEVLRGKTFKGVAQLFAEVKSDYEKIIEAIKKFVC